MSVPTIANIMAGIETRLQTISGLRTNDVVPGQIVVPFAFVGVPEIPDYLATLGRGHWDITPTITVGVSTSMDRAGQIALAGYVDHSGTNSIPAAIDADKTLNNLVEYCVVKSFRPQAIEIGQVIYYGGVFEVEVAASGS